MKESTRLRLITVAATLGIIVLFTLIFGSNPIIFVVSLWDIFTTAFQWVLKWVIGGGITAYFVVLVILLGLVYHFCRGCLVI